MSNAEIRRGYLAEVEKIAAANERWMQQGVSLSERARRCHALRREARLKARRLMADSAEVRLLETRDEMRYGSPDGPSFEQLMERYRGAGLTENQSLEAIIKGAQRTNALVSSTLALKIKTNR